MAKASSSGLMAESTRVSSVMTARRAKANFSGVTAASTKESGDKENNTVKVISQTWKAKLKKAVGKMESMCAGMMKTVKLSTLKPHNRTRRNMPSGDFLFDNLT